MIPFPDISTFHLGPLNIHVWGFFVSVGVVVALWVVYRRAKHFGVDGNRALDLSFWILISAFIGARLFHVFFYEWNYYAMHQSEIIRIDQGGLSSFGGFIGAIVAFWWYSKKLCHSERSEESRANARDRTSVRDSSPSAQNDRLVWRYANLLLFAWPLGHGIGRIGCFLTHMHPGRLSSVSWAVQYPGGARLDMGLIEGAVLLSYWAIIYLTTRGRRLFAGFYLVSVMIFYGIARFILDFFRAGDLPMSDARYLGLTPAQYSSVILLVGGIVLWHRQRRGAVV